MKSFESYRHIEITGESLHSVLTGMTATALAVSMMKRHGLSNIEKGEHYPLESYLLLLSEIESRMPSVLASCGRAIFDNALFPPDVRCLEDALKITNTAYYMNHRGAQPGELGSYRYEKEEGGDLLMTVTDVPYPCIFDEGILCGMARKFQKKVSLSHDSDTCRSRGDSSCVYRLKLEG